MDTINEQEFHFTILERLRQHCDRVAIALDKNWHEDENLLDRLEPYFLFSEWKRKYPGNSGAGSVKLCSYKICPGSIETFKQYESFLETGYDMSFYQDKKLVMFVLYHEFCYFVEDGFKKYFDDLLKLHNDYDVMGDIAPKVPDFEDE